LLSFSLLGPYFWIRCERRRSSRTWIFNRAYSSCRSTEAPPRQFHQGVFRTSVAIIYEGLKLTPFRKCRDRECLLEGCNRIAVHY
jgi:hypothetical protein